MADRNRAAIHIHFICIPTKIFVHGNRLRCKSLISFDEIEIANFPTSFFKRLARRGDWTRAHDGGINAGRCP